MLEKTTQCLEKELNKLYKKLDKKVRKAIKRHNFDNIYIKSFTACTEIEEDTLTQKDFDEYIADTKKEAEEYLINFHSLFKYVLERYNSDLTSNAALYRIEPFFTMESSYEFTRYEFTRGVYNYYDQNGDAIRITSVDVTYEYYIKLNFNFNENTKEEE